MSNKNLKISDEDSPPRKKAKLSNKPLIERRRRERINRSLTEIKELVLQESGNEEINSSKMEKADILEMTVKHLKERNSTSTQDVLDRYRAGYMACLQTTLDYLGNHSDLSKDVQMNLAQAISCRMLQYKKCEVIPSMPPLETRPRVHSDGSYNPLLSNQRNFPPESTNGIHGYRSAVRIPVSPLETSNQEGKFETKLPGPRTDRRSSNGSFAHASPDFLSQNEDSGFADDNVFYDLNNQWQCTLPAYNTNSNGSSNSVSSDNGFFRFSNKVSRIDSCSSEVWRPW